MRERRQVSLAVPVLHRTRRDRALIRGNACVVDGRLLIERRLFVERRRLLVERERLFVERQRLFVERQRLLVERQRLFVNERLVRERRLDERSEIEHRWLLGGRRRCQRLGRIMLGLDRRSLDAWLLDGLRESGLHARRRWRGHERDAGAATGGGVGPGSMSTDGSSTLTVPVSRRSAAAGVFGAAAGVFGAARPASSVQRPRASWARPPGTGGGGRCVTGMSSAGGGAGTGCNPVARRREA